MCDSLAESINNSQSSESGVQDLMEAMAKRKYYEEELKKINIEGENISNQLMICYLQNCICKKSMVSKDKPRESVQYLIYLRKTDIF